MKILVINAGSSSLKYQLVDPAIREVFAKRLCERIGIDDRLTHKVPAKGTKYEFEIPMPAHSETIQAVLDALLDAEHGTIENASEIDAVGHRMVHNGERSASSIRVIDEIIAALEECIPLTLLYNPTNITGIKTCEKVMPGVPMMDMFDTTFHQTIPIRNCVYALPYKFYEQDRVRRYGFHGTSHRYASTRAAAMLGKPTEELKIITCHLGNGSSMATVDSDKSVDTSMGFTSLTGVPMNTRAGDLDAGIPECLMGKYDYDMKEMMIILNKKSGMLGISGMSSNFHDLGNAAKEGNRRAGLTLEAFQHSVKKLMGAYAATVGGMNVITFTADVGENDATTRIAVASGLEFMGVKMDTETNNVRGKKTIISSANSGVKVLLIPTDEKLMIAMNTTKIVGK